MELQSVWASADHVHAICGVPDGKLRDLAKCGIVRSRKLGDTANCKTVYRVQDVLDWVEEQPEPDWVKEARSA